MRPYEIVYVLDATLDQDAAAEKLGAFHDLLGGEVEAVDHWGVRRLAYPIAKASMAYYAVAHVKADPAALPEFERRLKLDEQVMRYLVVLNEGQPASGDSIFAAPPPGAELEGDEEAEGDGEGGTEGEEGEDGAAGAGEDDGGADGDDGDAETGAAASKDGEDHGTGADGSAAFDGAGPEAEAGDKPLTEARPEAGETEDAGDADNSSDGPADAGDSAETAAASDSSDGADAGDPAADAGDSSDGANGDPTEAAAATDPADPEAAAGADETAEADGAPDAPAAEDEWQGPAGGPPEFAGSRGRGRRYDAPRILLLNYKDVPTLSHFVNDQGKILPKRTTKVTARFQRQLGTAVKRARYLALMPYVRDHGS